MDVKVDVPNEVQGGSLDWIVPQFWNDYVVRGERKASAAMRNGNWHNFNRETPGLIQIAHGKEGPYDCLLIDPVEALKCETIEDLRKFFEIEVAIARCRG